MKIKYLVAVISIAGLTTVGILNVGHTKNNPVYQEKPAAEKRGSIAWYVKKAKLKGEKKVTVPSPIDLTAAVDGLDDTLLNYTAVVVQPVDKKSYVVDDSVLMTWHKLRVLETLSRPPGPSCGGCSSHLTPPEEMLPLKADEIVVPTYGGTLEIDGVEVSSRDRYLRGHFLASEKYLLFLNLDSATGVGIINLGPHGVFTIDADDRVTPVVPDKHPINRDLTEKFSKSLTRLREHSRGRR